MSGRTEAANIESRKWAAGTHGQSMQAGDSRQANTDEDGRARSAGTTLAGDQADLTTRSRGEGGGPLGLRPARIGVRE